METTDVWRTIPADEHDIYGKLILAAVRDTDPDGTLVEAIRRLPALVGPGHVPIVAARQAVKQARRYCRKEENKRVARETILPVGNWDAVEEAIASLPDGTLPTGSLDPARLHGWTTVSLVDATTSADWQAWRARVANMTRGKRPNMPSMTREQWDASLATVTDGDPDPLNADRVAARRSGTVRPLEVPWSATRDMPRGEYGMVTITMVTPEGTVTVERDQTAAEAEAYRRTRTLGRDGAFGHGSGDDMTRQDVGGQARSVTRSVVVTVTGMADRPAGPGIAAMVERETVVHDVRTVRTYDVVTYDARSLTWKRHAETFGEDRTVDRSMVRVETITAASGTVLRMFAHVGMTETVVPVMRRTAGMSYARAGMAGVRVPSTRTRGGDNGPTITVAATDPRSGITGAR